MSSLRARFNGGPCLSDSGRWAPLPSNAGNMAAGTMHALCNACRRKVRRAAGGECDWLGCGLGALSGLCPYHLFSRTFHILRLRSVVFSCCKLTMAYRLAHRPSIDLTSRTCTGAGHCDTSGKSIWVWTCSGLRGRQQLCTGRLKGPEANGPVDDRTRAWAHGDQSSLLGGDFMSAVAGERTSWPKGLSAHSQHGVLCTVLSSATAGEQA